MSHKHSYSHLQQINNYGKIIEIEIWKEHLSTEIFLVQFSLGLQYFIVIYYRVSILHYNLKGFFKALVEV